MKLKGFKKILIILTGWAKNYKVESATRCINDEIMKVEISIQNGNIKCHGF